MLLLVVLALPLAAGVATAAVGWRPWVGWIHVVAAAMIFTCGAVLAVTVLADGPVSAFGNALRVDALSAFMILSIGAVATLSSWYATGYVRRELASGDTTAPAARLYGVLVAAFVTAMLVAVEANNLGVLWVALEATTVATAFLVGHHRSKKSLEASWKYVVIGSVGIALGFLGTILMYFASVHAPGAADDGLNWTSLVAQAPNLHPATVRLAIGLLVLGFGTKAGLVPMQTWLPDAYSQAPAPVSALMAGVLSSIAFYAILRYKVIADAAIGPEFTRQLLVAAGLGSLAVAASLMIHQLDFRRLVAYSSIEHMGLMALGAAAGSTLAMAAVLLHMLGHGLGKSVLFISSGEIESQQGTSQIAGVTGVLIRQPLVGVAFGVGVLALLGMPPFSLFASEVAIMRSMADTGLAWVAAIALVLILVVFASMITHVQRMLLGVAPSDAKTPAGPGVAVPLVVGLVACAVLGITIWPLSHLLTAAADIVGARP